MLVIRIYVQSDYRIREYASSKKIKALLKDQYVCGGVFLGRGCFQGADVRVLYMYPMVLAVMKRSFALLHENEAVPGRCASAVIIFIAVSCKPMNPIILVSLVVMAIHFLQARQKRPTLPGAEASMTTTIEFITTLFC